MQTWNILNQIKKASIIEKLVLVSV